MTPAQVKKAVKIHEIPCDLIGKNYETEKKRLGDSFEEKWKEQFEGAFHDAIDRPLQLDLLAFDDDQY